MPVLWVPGTPAAGIAASTMEGSSDSLSQWGGVLRDLVRYGEPALNDVFGAFSGWLPSDIKSRTLWSPLQAPGAISLSGEALVMSWGIVRSTNPYPWAAVYLSVLWGAFTKRLRLCREHECKTPFVWKHSWDQKCRVCALLNGRLRHPKVRIVMDRIRKWPNAKEKRSEALGELRVHSIPNWLGKWGNEREVLRVGLKLGKTGVACDNSNTKIRR